jgi:hypothetical protein
MFERYTEKARRIIFFARYEASAGGSPYIETHHLLLGLVRENKDVVHRYLDPGANAEEIRRAIADQIVVRESTSTVLDLPLSNECKRILAYSAEEADRLGHQHIGTEHLLLGILREEQCLAARLLRERGLDLQKARAILQKSEKEGPTQSIGSGIGSGMGRAGGRGAFPPSRPMVRIVAANGAAPLLTAPNVSALPRIGDAIRIRNAEGIAITYRVRDVVHEYDANAEASSLKDVEVTVVREDAIQ